MTSSGSMALPSWNFACGRSANSTQERSAGVSTVSQMRQYIVKGSSPEPTISVSIVNPTIPAATPRMIHGLKLSKVPDALWRTSPPLGAAGST